MAQITCRISIDTYDWIDKQCDSHEFRSYGHAVEKMAAFYRKGHRTISILKAERARLKGILEVVRSGEVGQKTQSMDAGNSGRAKED